MTNYKLIRMTRIRRFGSDGFHKLDILTLRALLRYSTVARHFAVVTFGIPELLANPLETHKSQISNRCSNGFFSELLAFG